MKSLSVVFVLMWASVAQADFAERANTLDQNIDGPNGRQQWLDMVWPGCTQLGVSLCSAQTVLDGLPFVPPHVWDMLGILMLNYRAGVDQLTAGQAWLNSSRDSLATARGYWQQGSLDRAWVELTLAENYYTDAMRQLSNGAGTLLLVTQQEGMLWNVIDQIRKQ